MPAGNSELVNAKNHFLESFEDKYITFYSNIDTTNTRNSETFEQQVIGNVALVKKRPTCHSYFAINIWVFYCVCVKRKNFAIAILVFLPSLHFVWTDSQRLFSQRLKINYQESVWPRSDFYFGHNKKYFSKRCSPSCYSRRVWHMAQLTHGNHYQKYPASTIHIFAKFSIFLL